MPKSLVAWCMRPSAGPGQNYLNEVIVGLGGIDDLRDRSIGPRHYLSLEFLITY